MTDPLEYLISIVPNVTRILLFLGYLDIEPNIDPILLDRVVRERCCYTVCSILFLCGQELVKAYEDPLESFNPNLMYVFEDISHAFILLHYNNRWIKLHSYINKHALIAEDVSLYDMRNLSHDPSIMIGAYTYSLDNIYPSLSKVVAKATKKIDSDQLYLLSPTLCTKSATKFLQRTKNTY